MKTNKNYTITLFTSHSKKNITNKIKALTPTGIQAITDYMYKSDIFCMRNGINVKGLDVSDSQDKIKTDCDLGLMSSIKLTRPVNTMVMSSILDPDSEFSNELRKNKKLIEYVSNLEALSDTPIQIYIRTVKDLSDGIIDVFVLIEDFYSIFERPFITYNDKCISLPDIEEKFSLTDSLTLLLSRNRQELPSHLNKYADIMDSFGFIQESQYIEILFNQLLYNIPSDSELHVALFTLSEHIFTKNMDKQGLLDILVEINKNSNVFYNLQPNELEPLAKYLIEVADLKNKNKSGSLVQQ